MTSKLPTAACSFCDFQDYRRLLTFHPKGCSNWGWRAIPSEPRDPFLAAGTVLGMVNIPYILFHSGKLVDPVLRDRMQEEVLSAAMTYLKKR